ncbi:MAG TPA: zinc-binding alcohol dehydrogenase family protein [Dongiaceae bacterium]|nr:zinc-binding alcohol dehydrogenase family protein [Dongiaceae bacterium]
MQALHFTQTGSLDQLRLTSLPLPEPGPGQVRVKVHAAGVNPSDLKNVLGRFPYTTLPRTPGRDFAGVVDKGPEHLLGKAVWGSGKELGFTADGSHAEYVVVDAAGVAPKPARLDFAQAASCGVPYLTAWDALERSQVESGSRVLIIGAAGAVGQAAVALAVCRGADVVGAVRRDTQCDAVRALGARPVLLQSGQPLQAFADDADVVFDTTGFCLPDAIGVLAPFGRVAIIAAPADGHERVPVLALYRKGGSLVGVNSLLYSSAQCAVLLNRIGAGFDSGAVPPPAGLRLSPLSSGRDAYHALDDGQGGKPVLVMG